MRIPIIILTLLISSLCFAQEVKISTLAGGVKQGDLPGPMSHARFYSPMDVAVMDNGNVLLTDIGNCKIKLINLIDLAVVDYAGSGECGWVDGPKGSAQFYLPHFIDINQKGEIFVVDLNNVMRKIDTAGIVSTFLATGEKGYKDGQKDTVEFAYMADFIIDTNNNFFIADAQNSRIRKLDTAGMVSTFTGSGPYYDPNQPWPEALVDGNKNQARFAGPWRLAFDSNYNILVADWYNHALRKVDSAGNVSTIIGTLALDGAGKKGYKDGHISEALLNQPSSICVTQDFGILIWDDKNTRIRQILNDSVYTLAGGLAGNRDGLGPQARFGTSGGTIWPYPGRDSLFLLIDVENDAIRLLKFEDSDEPILGGNWLLNNSFKTYPNPAKEQLTVQVSQGSSLQNVSLYDLAGRFIKSYGLNLANDRFEMPLGDVPAGIYMLKATIDGQEVMKRVVVE